MRFQMIGLLSFFLVFYSNLLYCEDTIAASVSPFTLVLRSVVVLWRVLGACDI
jgi:hypothetical protein